ncbi:MAG: TIGR04255 family protein [Planctomycetes bacterium]|nr:TIGR04255 family protein [Planctomycetota bacterium]
MAPKKPRTTSASRTRKLKKRYKKDFLDQVIVRVDFAAPIEIARSGPPRSVTNALAKTFPVPEPKKLVVQSVHVTPTDTERSSLEKHEWWYHSNDRRKLTRITDASLILEYKKGKHKDFAALQKDFLPVVAAMYDEFDGLQMRRLGLRYINKIEIAEGAPTEWRKYLDDDLLAVFGLADDKRTISRAMHWLEFNYGDTYLRFQYGMPNPDYPAPVRQKIFTLDYDAYCTLLLDKGDLANYLTRLHDKISPAFEQVIKAALRKRMGVINAK